MNMKKIILVYDDDIISVGLFKEVSNEKTFHLAMKWNEPKPYIGKSGELVETSNFMNGETNWFILPFTFAVSISKTLIEQKNTGMSKFFKKEGFNLLVNWLIDMEAITDAMCY